LSNEFFRLKIDMQMKIFHLLSRSRPDGRYPGAADFSQIIDKFEENIEKRFDAVRAGEHDPVVNVCVLDKLSEFAQITRRLDSNRWQFDNVGAQRAQLAAYRAGLFSCSRND